MSSCIRKNRDASIPQNLSGNPRCFVSGIHSQGFYFRKTVANRIIYGIPGNAVMNVAGSDFYCQYKAMPFAGGVGFIGKLPLVLTLYKHPTVRVCSGYCFLSFGWLVVVLVLNFFLAELCTLLVYFLAQDFIVDFCCFVDLFFLEFLLVCTCFNMRAVDKDHTGVYHPIVQSFI